MSSFLYYIPNHTGTVEPAKFGLGHAFDAPQAGHPVHGGPDGSDGVVCVDNTRPGTAPGYYKEKQTWRKMPGSDVWVGMYNADRPTPKDLARREQLDGHLVTMADDSQWLCPIARGFSEGDGTPMPYMALPSVLQLDEEGEWRYGEPLARYAPIWAYALEWFDVLSGVEQNEDGEHQVQTDFSIVDAAVATLAANYHLGPCEVAMLGLLTEPVCTKILAALVDLPTWQAWQEKKTDPAEDDSTTPDGGPDSGPATDQPSPT